MMSAPQEVLADDVARRDALVSHGRSLLVEAGAGSGKTAIMAGRISMMLAEGIAPRSIVAVTFTELAASELVMRVRAFVSALVEGDVPEELRDALPEGLSEAQRNHLESTIETIDDITCSTIHGFCRRIIKPYPVEADIDPGANVMDQDQADLVFEDTVESWLRERLSGDQEGLIAEMVLHDPAKTVSFVRTIVRHLRRHRTTTAPPAAPLPSVVREFRERVAAFRQFLEALDDIGTEEETAAISARFVEMAEETAFALTDDDPASLMKLLRARPHPDLRTKAGCFSAYKKKGKWEKVAKRAGLAKADGDRHNDAAEGHYKAICEAWNAMLGTVASRVLAGAMAEVRPALERYHDYKRRTARLDFDDLIFAARDLLRDHDEVRRALADRYAHVLVDEFQDTDPVQVEIFWRLCGDPPDRALAEDWKAFRVRPGALFLVGDPNQAIYRFRGADVNTYVWARDAYRAQDADSVVSISTNFRSRASILTYVNERFEDPLSSEGQPGFTKLHPRHADAGGGLGVAALDLAAAYKDDSATPEQQQRNGEAKAVAEMCARLIGNKTILDRRIGETRPCRAGDIALLAPTGNDLWRYEEALEHLGVPVATQAGKGFFRRQEIQDLIALTRALADRQDTLALGALLRGPLVGLTEEELLDVVWTLPRSGADPYTLPRLELDVDPARVEHPLAKDILGKLQGLRRRANSTTPHSLLSQAVDVLRVRPILLQRHRGQAERALANVDLYLSLARVHSVRGLRAFAEAMASDWADEARAMEGRPDAQEGTVALYTMHAAKGLEWPIVVPVNTMTRIKKAESAVIDRENDRFYSPVFGVRPAGYNDAHNHEKAELTRERIRLWYVAATRARELLVLPDFGRASSNAWRELLDLSLADLPKIDLADLPVEPGVEETPRANLQTREIFQREAAAIAKRQHHLHWLDRSQEKSAATPAAPTEDPDVVISTENDDSLDEEPPVAVQGSRERGQIIHKLFEEVLTDETADDTASLIDRAVLLVRALGQPISDDPGKGLSPDEIANCVTRALALPEIAELRPTLVPEFPVYAFEVVEDAEQVTTGITDATSFGIDGAPQAIIDWKSDVDPQPDAMERYRDQMQSYLRTTEVTKGLLVFVTPGTVVRVSRSAPRVTRSGDSS